MSVAVALLAAIAVLSLPGLPVVLSLRLRPLAAAAMTAPVSLFVVTASAELGSRLGVPWTPLSPLMLGVLLALPVLLLMRSRRPAPASRARSRTAARARSRTAVPSAAAEPSRAEGRTSAVEPALAAEPMSADEPSAPAHRRERLAILAGLGVGAVWTTSWLLASMGSLHAVSQTYDEVFHLNAIRRILRFHDGSAWVVGGMTKMPGESGFYPALWHQAASLVTQLSGGDIVLASNALMLLLAAAVWPLGLVALVRTCTSAGGLGLLLAGALSGVSAAFPLALTYWGIVLPYFLAMTLMPALVLLSVQALRMDPGGEQRLGARQLAVLVPAVLGAAVLAHPQAVFSAIVLVAPILLWAVAVRAARLIRRRPAALAPLLTTAGLALVGLPLAWFVWMRFRPVQASAVWDAYATPREAIGQALSLSATWTPTYVPLGAVVGLALVLVAVRSRERWLAVSLVVALAHGAAARTIPMSDLRYLIAGNWYADTMRITAIAPVVAIPVLAVALDLVGGWVRERGPQRLRGGAAPAVLSGALVAVLLATAAISPAWMGLFRTSHYSWTSSELLSPDERELLERLPEVVPEGSVIATNAWNGSSLAYAISDRDVLNTFMGFSAPQEVHLLNAKLDEANTDPEVCGAAADLHVDYALDFGPEELFGNRATYTGLNEISTTGAATEVMRVGEASLWKIDPCLGPDGTMLE